MVVGSSILGSRLGTNYNNGETAATLVGGAKKTAATLRDGEGRRVSGMERDEGAAAFCRGGLVDDRPLHSRHFVSSNRAAQAHIPWPLE